MVCPAATHFANKQISGSSDVSLTWRLPRRPSNSILIPPERTAPLLTEYAGFLNLGRPKDLIGQLKNTPPSDTRSRADCGSQGKSPFSVRHPLVICHS